MLTTYAMNRAVGIVLLFTSSDSKNAYYEPPVFQCRAYSDVYILLLVHKSDVQREVQFRWIFFYYLYTDFMRTKINSGH